MSYALCCRSLRQFTRNFNFKSKHCLHQNQSKLFSFVRQINVSSLVKDKSAKSNTKGQPIAFSASTADFHKFRKIMDSPDGVLKGMTDRFNGITVDSSQRENQINGDFVSQLEKSLAFWIENKFRGIWFIVYRDQADWIPHLVKKGFNFHHAKSGFVTLYKWLPIDEPENIPDYAHTMIGVGGLVVNDKNEVLCVSDRFALIPDSWKLPGGYVEPNENLIDAAIREVQEETGIQSVFETMISIRHSHGGGFGCSDIYVVIALKPITIELQRCTREIAKCSWMPINEFLIHPNVHEGNRQFIKLYLMYKKYGIKIKCEEKIHQILKKKYAIYMAELNSDKKLDK